MLAPVSIWERSHNYHHAHNSKLYTSSIGSFPIVTKEKYLSSPKSERTVYLFIRHPITIGMGYIFMFLYGMCIRSLVSNKDRTGTASWPSCSTSASAWASTSWRAVTGLLLGFICPFIVALGLGSYLFYAQHNFPGPRSAEKDGWTYARRRTY